MIAAPRRSATRRIPTRSRAASVGLTLVEMLLVVAILGLLAGMVVPNISTADHEQLVAAAQIVESELNYARALAINNGSQYRVVFDVEDNRLILRHSGADETLEQLPSSPFLDPLVGTTRQVTDFDELPRMQAAVRLVGAYRQAAGLPSITNVEFGPLGNTISTTDTTVLYLESGQGRQRLILSVLVDPVTGLVTYGSPVSSLPSRR